MGYFFLLSIYLCFSCFHNECLLVFVGGREDGQA